MSLAKIPTDLSVVVPVFRSQDTVGPLVAAIHQALDKTLWNYEIVLVEDGSPDDSWREITSICRKDDHVIGVSLGRNFGQDGAIMAGLRIARGNAIIIMDDDLQHDPGDIPALASRLEDGFDVVYARFADKKQSWWKNFGSWFNGVAAQWVLDKPSGLYLSPYKAMSRWLVDQVCQYQGPEPYVDGLILQRTKRVSEVPAIHHARAAGVGNYDLIRSIRLWTRVVFAFSARPLRVMGPVALFFGILGVVLAMSNQGLFAGLFGLASLNCFLVALLGEYVGRIASHVQGKPQALVRNIIGAAAPQIDPERIGEPEGVQSYEH